MTEREKPKHDTVMDVTAERLARVYAQAFWGVAVKQTDVAATVSELRAVVTDVLDKYPALETMLGSALVDQSEKERILDRLFANSLSAPVLNFLKVLLAHNRLEILRLVAKEIAGLEREHLGQAEVEIRVADPLDPVILGELHDALRRRLQKEPILKVTVDPDVVGGIIVKIGDTVYDGSLKRRFEMARKSIIARATDMIQTNRDQFINAAI
jgi:F-type H+-transporting ATPase subunit delta